MSRRSVLTILLIFVALTIGVAIYIDRRAELREAAIEVRFPPIGSVVQVDGRDVHVIVRGEGPDLVLIHGAGGNAREFTTGLADTLAADYRLFIVDRPGFGWSERIDVDHVGAFRTSAESPADQARVLAAAVRQLGAATPLVLGHSYGASVALAWALDEPASGVIVISGATMPWPGPLDGYYRLLGSTFGGATIPQAISALLTPDRLRQTVDGIFAPQAAPANYLKDAGVPLATRTDTLRANARQVNTLRPHIVTQSARYGEIGLPVEIIHGDADTTTPIDVHAIPLSQTIPGANLVILSGVGHMAHQVAMRDVKAAIDRAAERAGLR